MIEAITLYVLNRCCFGRIVGFSTESRSSDPSAGSMILYPTIHGSHDITVLTTPKILLKEEYFFVNMSKPGLNYRWTSSKKQRERNSTQFDKER